MGEMACPDVGPNARRSCTDKLCTLIFIVFSALLLALLIFAVSDGDLKRITHGTDYNGNVCGDGFPDGLTITETEWQSRKYMWYPFSYDTATNEFRITSAINYGICVSDCNPASGDVTTYGGEFNPTPQTFSVIFNSNEQFYRCVPDFTSFNCPTGAFEEVCQEASRRANAVIDGDLGITSFLFTFARQVYRNLWITALFLLAAIVLCFIWLVLMRRIVKPFVVIILVLTFCAFAGVVIALWFHYKTLTDDPSTDGTDESRLTLAFAIIASALLFIYLCVLIFLWKSIMMSCDVIEEGTRMIVDMPQITLVPIFNSVFIFGYLILFASIAVFLFTHGKIKMVNGEVEVGGTMTSYEAVEYDRPTYADVFQGYNIFMILWLMGFQNAVAFMIIAYAGVMWFFSAPGDDKDASSPVCSGLCTILRYHIGTAAFGSLLMAIIAFARLMLQLLEKRLQAMGEKVNWLCCICICCAKCCLSCLERIVKFFTEQGYIMTAMTGKSMIPAAREGVSLVMSTPAILTINVISGIIVSISKWFVVLVITLCGAYAYNSYSEWDASVAACVVMLFIGTWYIATLFTNILLVCVDTTLLCFAWDAKYNNGLDRPFYSPNDLRTYIDKQPTKAQQRQYAKDQQEQQQRHHNGNRVGDTAGGMQTYGGPYGGGTDQMSAQHY